MNIFKSVMKTTMVAAIVVLAACQSNPATFRVDNWEHSVSDGTNFGTYRIIATEGHEALFDATFMVDMVSASDATLRVGWLLTSELNPGATLRLASTDAYLSRPVAAVIDNQPGPDVIRLKWLVSNMRGIDTIELRIPVSGGNSHARIAVKGSQQSWLASWDENLEVLRFDVSSFDGVTGPLE